MYVRCYWLEFFNMCVQPWLVCSLIFHLHIKNFKIRWCQLHWFQHMVSAWFQCPFLSKLIHVYKWRLYNTCALLQYFSTCFIFIARVELLTNGICNYKSLLSPWASTFNESPALSFTYICTMHHKWQFIFLHISIVKYPVILYIYATPKQ